jgi:hypothetical protein
MEFVRLRLIANFSEGTIWLIYFWLYFYYYFILGKVYGDFVETYAEDDRELRTECLSNKKLWKN